MHQRIEVLELFLDYIPYPVLIFSTLDVKVVKDLNFVGRCDSALEGSMVNGDIVGIMEYCRCGSWLRMQPLKYKPKGGDGLGS